jgi:hypothetical protein
MAKYLRAGWKSDEEIGAGNKCPAVITGMAG